VSDRSQRFLNIFFEYHLMNGAIRFYERFEGKKKEKKGRLVLFSKAALFEVEEERINFQD
jgi:hypothetical protein